VKYTRYQKASEVGQADGNVYQRGQTCETVINGQRFLHYLNGYRNGSAVWVLMGQPPKKREKANKRPEVQRSAFGYLTARGKEKRNVQSRPNAPLNYKMGRKSA